MKEIRVKSEYMRLTEVKASMGIRISAPGLQDTIAGSQLLVCGPRDDKEALMVCVILAQVRRVVNGFFFFSLLSAQVLSNLLLRSVLGKKSWLQRVAVELFFSRVRYP